HRPARARRCARERCDRVRVLGARSGALWRGRVRRHRSRDRPRGKARASEILVGGHRPVFLRRTGLRTRRRPRTVAARRARDHRPQPALSRGWHADARTARTRLRVARHRHPRVADRGVELHPDDREPPGAQGVLSRGNRVAERLDRCRTGRAPRRAAREERLRTLPAATAGTGGDALKLIESAVPDCIVIEPDVFGDARGFFYESFNARKFADAGLPTGFVQTNVSRSAQGVLRGLHYQWPNPQGKLVSVLEGEVYDVAVDIRVGSPTFGRWAAAVLSADNKRHFWIPEGFAHGFAVLSENATFTYQCTALYDRAADAGIRWN